MIAPAAPSEAMRSILDRLAAEDAGAADPTTLAPEVGRAQAARMNRRWNVDLPAMAEVLDFTLPGGDGGPVRCRVVAPEGARPGLVLHHHGGGFAFCDIDSHERAARMLAIACGVAVLTFDYRLAPEHPFPAGLDDAVAIWRHAVRGSPPLDRFAGPTAVAGDSAGANLAFASMLSESAAGRPLPDMGLLFYGNYGVDFETPSYIDFADGPGLTRAKMIRYWDWYVPPEQRRDPRVVPLAATDAALAALPPLYLNAAEIDPLRSDTERLHARLSALGRDDGFRLHGGVVHGFMQMSRELEEARRAFDDAGAAFRARTGAEAARQGTAREEQR